jgi:hypothetical protein
MQVLLKIAKFFFIPPARPDCEHVDPYYCAEIGELLIPKSWLGLLSKYSQCLGWDCWAIDPHAGVGLLGY